MAMNMRQSLGLRLGQELRLTPQMRMNLELIQAPILEALEALDQKTLENPWLEKDENVTDPRLVRDADREPESTITAKEQVEYDAAEAWEPVASTPYTHEEFPADEGGGIMAVNVPTPYEQLESQLSVADVTRRVHDIILVLLRYLDEYGYLLFSENELFEALELPASVRPEFDHALYMLRYQFDPPGLAARDQSHCYLIQLERHGKSDSLAAQLVRDNVLSTIKPRNLAAVAKKLGVKESELHDALEDLNRLYSHPMSLLDQSTEPTRYPDLIVELVDGQWAVSLSHPLSGRYRFRDTRIPRKASLVKESGDEDPKAILDRLRAMRQDARMLVNATEYRDRMLFEIGRHLVEEQREFLERGEEALKPLLQKETAERLGMNEATISRILKEKYIQTPRGVIPLNRFFSRSITNNDGKQVSNKAVMDTLNKLINEEEDPANPWSDHEISEILKQRNSPISRRTVTKYRQILGIGAAGDRKATGKIQASK